MTEPVYVNNLTRQFVSKKGIIHKQKKITDALKGISFNINQGEVFGLLGENGAGKTTTIKILTTLLLPTSGDVRILGYNPVNQEKQIRPRINFVFGGERSLYWRLSARENLQYFCDLYKLDIRSQKKRIDEVLDIVKLRERADEKVETYSKGMKQRLQIARGMINNPEIIFLDEPTIGLDPIGALDLRTTIRHLQSLGKTLLLTTHYMYEADDLCNRIAIMKKGKIIKLDSPKKIKQLATDKQVISIEALGLTTERIARLRALDSITNVSIQTQEQIQLIELHCNDSLQAMNQVMAELDGQQVLNITSRDATLEDAYVQLIGGE